MSRSGYSDDCDGWALIRWRGAVESAARGKRGQAALKELLTTLDSMERKELAPDNLVTPDGEFCALGALGHARGLDMSKIDPDDRESVASAFGIAPALAAEIMFLNDQWVSDDRRYFNFVVEGPMRPWEKHTQLRWERDTKPGERRWLAVRQWVAEQIKESEKV